jgi:FkbM family methyltransferase
MMYRIHFVIAGICYKILQSIRRSTKINTSGLAVFADDDLGLRIACFGEFEGEILSYIRQRLGASMKDKTLVDIGANLGNHTNGLCNHFSSCHSIEADPRTFRLLQANLADKENVTCHQIAISDQDGITGFCQDRDNTGKSHVVETMPDHSHVNTPGSYISVTTRRLDSVIDISEKIGLVKIDVEGHEMQVLRGAHGIITAHKPSIIIELLAENIIDGRAGTLDYLAEIGYSKFEIVRVPSLHIAAINDIPMVRWINHVLQALETIVLGKREAIATDLDISALKKQNYDAILVSK